MKTIEQHTTGTLPPAEAGHPLQVGSFVFKRATTEEELEQLHALNYRTFVREIPQHEADGSGRLVDKFHHKNVYFIAKRRGKIVAMIAVHGEAPFSVSSKLEDPTLLEAYGRPLEARLLAIEPGQRNGPIFAGLNWVMIDYAMRHGYSHLLISGFQDRLSLYERLGFRAFAPAKQSGDAWFVPMVLDIEHMPPGLARDVRRWERHLRHASKGANGSDGESRGAAGRVEADVDGRAPGPPLHLLPGPVQMSAAVRDALRDPPIYHRSRAFDQVFHDVRAALCRMVDGQSNPAARMAGRTDNGRGGVSPQVALFNGSGTLANDIVGATLAADRSIRRGLILVNGEFGRRLVRQARRWGLLFNVIERPWGEPWSLDAIDAIESARSENPDVNWVWAVHLETSTGMLNDLSALLARARRCGLRVCLDCVSSLGATPLDLSDPCIHLASATSGKSLGGKAGAAMVFTKAGMLDGVDPMRVPTYYDLAAALECGGPRFTFPSQDLVALDAALQAYDGPLTQKATFERYANVASYVRRSLRRLGLCPIVNGEAAAPVITSFTPPRGVRPGELVDLCRQWGVLIGGESSYLKERGWLQIANMGDVSEHDCERLFARLETFLERP